MSIAEQAARNVLERFDLLPTYGEPILTAYGAELGQGFAYEEGLEAIADEAALIAAPKYDRAQQVTDLAALLYAAEILETSLVHRMSYHLAIAARLVDGGVIFRG